MLRAGERALLEELGDEYDGHLSSRTPGLQIACGRVLRAMLGAAGISERQKIVLLCPNNNLTGKLGQIFLRHALTCPVKVAAAQAHLTYRVGLVRFHRPWIMNIGIPLAGGSIDTAEELHKNNIGSLAFLAALQNHFCGRKN
jgi:hypothetical protein